MMSESEYKELLDKIFVRFPSVQNSGFGASSYKPGLEHMTEFLDVLGNPHGAYKTVHVAGTNGKGSVCNMLASALAATGLKTGLYTSPHILDFRERMRVLDEGKARGCPPKARNYGQWPLEDTPAPSSRHARPLLSRHARPDRASHQYGQSRQPLGCHFDRSGEIYKLVPKEYVFEFLKQWGSEFERLNLSFFEITTGMAFKWFADAGVDIAVIEVGLGGRLDSTNVITPELSIITSIGLDHCDLLGDTLEKIAGEKAGIIKPGVPVVIGEYRPETAPVFIAKATENNSPIFFAEDFGHLSNPQKKIIFPDGAEKTNFLPRSGPTRQMPKYASSAVSNPPSVISSEVEKSHITLDLQGEYQEANLRTVLTALSVLADRSSSVMPDLIGHLTPAVLSAIAHTAVRAGFGGRWEHLCEQPLVICDIGHNAHALKHNFGQLEDMMASGVYDCLIIVYAVMADKDLDAILPLMPKQARYIFTTPKGKRALPAERIRERFLHFGRNDKNEARNDKEKASECALKAIDDVQEAVKAALQESSEFKKPIIYIGGSTFAVAEAKPLFR